VTVSVASPYNDVQSQLKAQAEDGRLSELFQAVLFTTVVHAQ